MRTARSLLVAGLALVFIVAAVPVLAHHAFNAEFDANKPVKFKGTVTKMLWVNPHAWIYVDVKKPDGTVEEWAIETGTPNTLLRRGLTKDVRGIVVRIARMDNDRLIEFVCNLELAAKHRALNIAR